MERHQVACIIPAFNEENNIREVLRNIKNTCTPIVVNDGSTDNTSNVALDEGAIIVSHDCNKGYDQAIESGFYEAKKRNFRYAITIDADGQHDADSINSFIDLLDDGADLVVGIRDKMQRFGEHVFSWISNAKYGIKDPLCGMKAYSIDLYEEMGCFDSSKSVGTQLMFFAAKKNKKIEQLKVKTYDRKDASRFGSKLSANYKIFLAIIRVFSR